MARELSGWEQVVSAQFAELGFRYFPHTEGGGYWLIPDQYKGCWERARGLQLVQNLEVFRGGGTYWELARVDGLKIFKMRLKTRKRVWEKEGQDIKSKIVAVLSRPDWTGGAGWYLDEDLEDE